ncbi:MAG: DegT/DnrJ/EryC1/StrS family aminotransferase, partial [Verrucomicrobiota bacterium]|nr:DegT/DnrJ/EryC1/StrS family aminotransferase [Verrucomicrobiota bacterium]
HFSSFAETRETVGVNSGTSALHLALLAAGVGPGDEVIAPAMTFLATVSAIEYAGATPVLVDVEPDTYCLDPSRLRETITEKTRAIIPVHLYGQPADMPAILTVARERGISVIEDAAQAHGATLDGRPCGSMGDFAAFSFYPGKNLGACGEAGAVTTDDPDKAQLIRSMRDWGQEGKGNHVNPGFNYRMDGLQGAFLNIKLGHLRKWTDARNRVAERYRELLAGEEELRLPVLRSGSRHAHHVFAILTPERNRIANVMLEAGIGYGIHYSVPIHLHPTSTTLGYSQGDFPVAERIASEELSLPIYPELTDEQMVRIAETLIGALHA